MGNDAQKQREHEQTLKRIEADSKNQAREHEIRLQELNNKREEDRRIYEQEIKAKEGNRLQELCKEYKIKIDEVQKEIKRIETKCDEEYENYNKENLQVEKLEKNLSELHDDEYQNICGQYEKAKINVENAQKEVDNFINNTGVPEENIKDFLLLTNALIPGALKTIENSNNLNTLILNAKDLLDRRFTDQLTIQNYLSLQKFDESVINAFLDEGGEFMEDIQSSPENFENDILSLLPNAKENLGQLSVNKLKRICTEPEKTWKPKQTEQCELNKQILLASSPMCSIFFNNCYEAIKQANELLALNAPENFNYQQQQVISQNPDISKLEALTTPIYDSKFKINDDDEKKK